LRRALLRVILTGLCAAMLPSTSWSAAQPYVRTRVEPIISDWSWSVIAATAVEGRARVWVFFTDKGYYDTRGFTAAKAQHNVALTLRAEARRAKVGMASVRHRDIPVRQVYLDRLVDRGAEMLYASKWLNAAAVEVDVARLDEIAAQPFVVQIRPSITHTREKVEEPPGLHRATPGEPLADAMALDYGASAAQIEQINVHLAHIAGYAGQGVLICMLDTGYRKSHAAFADLFADGRMLAEWDFIFDDGETQDEAEDQAGAHNHGTYTWSSCGGAQSGQLYGPAYEADFLLAKTEDIRSETQIEEFYWVAALEWADSIGASVISSSLSYSDWYVASNYNGDFCVTTIAADMAAENNILVCNAAGNAGPNPATLGAPADADSILTVGAVNASNDIAGFSSRGPTYDGRIKPEVCALGVSTVCASAANDASYTTKTGTSLSTPLVAGAVAVVMSAHPEWTAMQVREALMQTASNGTAPNNSYGWGVIDVWAAINYNPCGAPGVPEEPVTSEPQPCPGAVYVVSWPPATAATEYELYEDSLLVYTGPDTAFDLSHVDGSRAYYVLARNDCGEQSGPLGAVTVVISECVCHADPVCDGVINVFDVVAVVNEAFRNGAPLLDPGCPHISRSDSDCDCVVNVFDVVRAVDVAFRNGDAEALFCKACEQPCL